MRGPVGAGSMANARKILIVDDDPELRDALVEQLALHEEFEAVAVENGSKGVQAAKAGQIDLVIMDVGLPDVDGREAVRILRKNGFKAPIIMLTGHETNFRHYFGARIGRQRLRNKAVPFRRAARAYSRATAPARGQRRCGLHHRPVHVPAELEAIAEPQGQQGPPHREGNRNSALSLSGRAAAGLARDLAARSVGLQFRRDHPHARNPHLPATPEGREGRGESLRFW